MAEEVISAAPTAPAAAPEPAPASAPATPSTTPALVPQAPAQEPVPAPAPQTEPPADPAPKEEPTQSEAPEEYADFTDEKGVAFPAKDMPEFTSMAKQLGLSQETANKLLMTMVPAVRGKLGSSVKALNDTWKKASLSDPEFGGESFKANMKVANEAYRKFVTPELASLMQKSGLAMHPDYIRMFYRIGKSMSQDMGVAGTGSPQPSRKRFPNSNM